MRIGSPFPINLDSVCTIRRELHWGNGHGPSSDILDNRVGNNGRLTFAICAQLLWTQFASLLLRSAKVLILRIDSRSIPFVSRNTMPPKQPTVEPTSGFVAKREDFPSLSPSPGGSSSGVARDRTARLEDITVDLARGQTTLFEGQHQLSLQIGEIVQGLRATTSVSSGGPSVPAQAPIGTQVPTSGEQLSQHPPFSAAAQQTACFFFSEIVFVLFGNTLFTNKTDPFRKRVF